MKQARHSRRQFMNVTGAAVAGLTGLPAASAAGGCSARGAEQAATSGGQDPDLIVVNAKVSTIDSRSPRAEAFAVTDGRFMAVGASADIKGLAGSNMQTCDANGMAVVPGFIDCERTLTTQEVRARGELKHRIGYEANGSVRTDDGCSPRRFISALVQYSSADDLFSSNLRYRWE